MGIFHKILGKNAKTETPSGSEDVINRMMLNAKVCMDQGKFGQAALTYKQIIELQPIVDAMYNLGSLYAQGKGVEQSFIEGAYWFHQAALAGDKQAEKLRTKCMADYLHQNLDQKAPQTVYTEMLRLTSHVYPREDSAGIAVAYIYALAKHHFGQKEYAAAAKLFRASAEYGNLGEAQNYLAVLYNAGAGVEKDDLAALYWFDRAADKQIETAKQDRNGILHAYKTNLSAEKFYDTMQLLSCRCTSGDADIPKDAEKAAYWRSVGERKA